MIQTIVKRTCDHCNKEYELNMGQNNIGYCYNFGPCPHCKKRNDVWITIELQQINGLEESEEKKCVNCKYLFTGKTDDGRFYSCDNQKIFELFGNHGTNPDFGCINFEL